MAQDPENLSNISFGAERDFDENYYTDPLGISLVEDYYTDPLGISLVEDFCENSVSCDVSFDPVGISLIEDTENEGTLRGQEEFDPSEFGEIEHLLTSTPTKNKRVIDTEQISSVLASPFITEIRKETSPCKRMQIRALNEEVITEDITQQCKCENECIDQFTFSSVKDLRETYWKKDKQQRSSWLISKLKNGFKKGRFQYVFMDTGHKICIKALGLLMHIDRNNIAKHKKLAFEGCTESITVTYRGITDASVAAIAWIETYASLYGDRMPHNADTLLPYKTQIRNIYKMYSEEVSKPLAESSFYRVWKNHFPTVKVKKWAWSVFEWFGECYECTKGALSE